MGQPQTRIVWLCLQVAVPYRALSRQLDGETKSPNGFDGPIGQQIAGPAHHLPLAAYPKISYNDWVELPEKVEHELSSGLRLVSKCALNGDASVVANWAHDRLYQAMFCTKQGRLYGWFQGACNKAQTGSRTRRLAPDRAAAVAAKTPK